MSRILLSRTFEIEGFNVTLTAGVKDGRALVVFGLPRVSGFNQLSSITIEYPMKTAQHALHFVETATEEVAARGLAKYRNEVADVAEMVNQALNQPYQKEVGYRRRGK